MSRKRDYSQQRMIPGAHAVFELIERHPEEILAIYAVHHKGQSKTNDVIDHARANRIAVRFEEESFLDGLVHGVRHQGIVAEAKPYQYADFEDELIALQNRERATVVVLDGLQDPHNLGAVLRSACAFGVDLIVIGKDRAAQITPLVERVSVGASLIVPVAKVNNLRRAIDELKETGFWTVGAATEGGKSLTGFDFAQKVALVIGSEDSGFRITVENAIDFQVTIPISAQMESLNASVATALMLYERSRGQPL